MSIFSRLYKWLFEVPDNTNTKGSLYDFVESRDSIKRRLKEREEIERRKTKKLKKALRNRGYGKFVDLHDKYSGCTHIPYPSIADLENMETWDSIESSES